MATQAAISMDSSALQRKLSSLCSCYTLEGRPVHETVGVRSGSTIQVQSVSDISLHLPYISSHVLWDESVSGILISKPPAEKIRQKLESADSEPERDQSAECMGSPLKLHSVVDYADVDRQIQQSKDKIRVHHKHKTHLYPVSSKIARECLSAVTLSGNTDTPVVLCLCDPLTSKDGAMVLGCYNCKSGKRKLLSITYNELHQADSMEKYNQILKQHKRRSPQGSSNEHASAYTEYNMMSLSSASITDTMCEDVDVFSSSSSVRISCAWSTVDRLLMTPPPDSVATLTLNVVCGDKSSIVYSLYEELQYLKDLTAGLSSGKVRWPDVERSSTPLELCTALLQSSSDYEQGTDSISAAQSHNIHINSIEQRKNLDFTDKLWSILTGCQSYSELVDVLKLVIQSVTHKTCPPLMVSAGNTNTLAKWIHAKQIEGDTGSDLELGGLQSIIYFIEIGLEKLTKDYIHCYLGNFSGLVTADKLDKLTKKCVIQERIDNLTKLHTVLELAALLHGYLRLPLATVRSSTAFALSYITDHSSLPADGFKLTTTVSTVSQIINSQAPDLWTVQLGEDHSSNLTEIRITKSEPEQSLVITSAKEDGMEDEKFYCIVTSHTEIDSALSG